MEQGARHASIAPHVSSAFPGISRQGMGPALTPSNVYPCHTHVLLFLRGPGAHPGPLLCQETQVGLHAGPQRGHTWSFTTLSKSKGLCAPSSLCPLATQGPGADGRHPSEPWCHKLGREGTSQDKLPRPLIILSQFLGSLAFGLSDA